MERETALHLAQQLALKVKGLEDNDVFATAVQAVNAELIEQWQNSVTPGESEPLWYEYKALRRVLRKLDEFVSQGDAARHELAQIEARQMRDTAA